VFVQEFDVYCQGALKTVVVSNWLGYDPTEFNDCLSLTALPLAVVVDCIEASLGHCQVDRGCAGRLRGTRCLIVLGLGWLVGCDHFDMQWIANKNECKNELDYTESILEAAASDGV
jgi:hypothetical protein